MRFWDKKTESFVSPLQNGMESVEDIIYNGEAAFTWSLAMPDVAASLRTLGDRVAMVLYVGNGGEKSASPTHFVDIGSYCESNPEKFVDLSTNQMGCQSLTKPKLSAKMPKSSAKLNGTFSDAYCRAAAAIGKDIGSSEGKLGVAGAIQNEQKLAKVLCDKNGKFVGFSSKEIKDQNTRALANVAVAEQGVGRIQFLARELNPKFEGIYISYRTNFSRDKQVSFDSDFYSAYPDLNQDTYNQVRNQAQDLANFYRLQ